MPLQFTSFDFLINRIPGRRKGCLNSLSNDIIIDFIFIHLDVESILRMRRVSKLYYYLSLQPSVWKRLLRKLQPSLSLPLPPLPPTSRHSLPSLTALETERLLVRSLSLDRNWRSPHPDCYDDWKFDAHHRILEMKLLPGSQYMVASVSDQTHQRYSIVVFAMDHPYGRAVPIAKTPTEMRAFGLVAKYMTVKGRRGIVISYVNRVMKQTTRSRRNSYDSRVQNLYEFSGDPTHSCDYSLPFVYQCTTLDISLQALEQLCDPQLLPGSKAFLDFARSQPPPFRRLAAVTSRKPLHYLTLDEVWGMPYIAMVKSGKTAEEGKNTILFKNLEGGGVSTLNCNPDADFPNNAHEIMAIRILPHQNQILVVRQIDDVNSDLFPIPKPVYPIEIYPIPINPNLASYPHSLERVEESMDALGRGYILHENLASCVITDTYNPCSQDDSIQPMLFKDSGSTEDRPPPRPISILGRTFKPEGMLRCTLYPKAELVWLPPTPAASPTSRSPSPFVEAGEMKPRIEYRFHPLHCSPIRSFEAPLNTEYRILPGSIRSVLYTVPWDDISDSPSVLEMFRYFDEESLEAPPSLVDPGIVPTEEELEKPRRAQRRFAFDMEENKMQAMAWDETVGRLCMSVKDSSMVFVLDFASAPREDISGVRQPPRSTSSEGRKDPRV